MRLSMPGRGDRLKEFLKFLALIIIVAGLAYGGWLTYRHFHNSKSIASSGETTVGQFEKGTQDVTQAALKSKDYSSYINSRIILASHYVASRDYNDAERVMKEIFTNVPKNVINSGVYEQMVTIEQGKGDNAQYKYYLGLLVEQLKKEGDTQGAAGYQKQLDSAK